MYPLRVSVICIPYGFWQLFYICLWFLPNVWLTGYGKLYSLWVSICMTYGFQLYMLWVFVTSLEKKGKTFVYVMGFDQFFCSCYGFQTFVVLKGFNLLYMLWVLLYILWVQSICSTKKVRCICYDCNPYKVVSVFRFGHFLEKWLQRHLVGNVLWKILSSGHNQ